MKKVNKKPIILIFIFLFVFMLALLHKQYLNANTTLSFPEYIMQGDDAFEYDNTKNNNGISIEY